MKNIVLFDVDGTIINGQSQLMLIKHLYKKKLIGTFFLLKLYAWFIVYKFHLVKDPRKIMEYSFGFMKNWKITETEEIFKKFYEEILKDKIFPATIEIIESHFKNKDEIVLVTNINYPLAQVIGGKILVSKIVASLLEYRNGCYTGKLGGPIVYGENKAKLLNNFLNSNYPKYKITHSYADHLSDLPMLELAESPVVVNPGRKLKKIAEEKNWKILKLKIKL
jgi:HAD superfamily hydrolase (TIGR01490 family)